MSATLGQVYLQSVSSRFKSYKQLGDKTFQQLAPGEFHFTPNEASNSIAVIIHHMSGNMLSRWTNFLTEDGEKPWRQRDEEFEANSFSKDELLAMWEKGWACLFNAIDELKDEDLLKSIHIRNEPLVAIDAINRQLAHYASHVGQLMYIGKLIKNTAWKTLSIEKGKSREFNQQAGSK